MDKDQSVYLTKQNHCIPGIVVVIAVLLAAPGPSGAQVLGTVASPGSIVSVSVKQMKVPPAGDTSKVKLFFEVRLQGRVIIGDSPLGVMMQGRDGDFVNNLTFVNKSTKAISEKYVLPSGKKRVYINNANEVTLAFKNSSDRQMNLIVHAADDGMAFRYHFPGSGENKVIVREESAFAIPAGSIGWGQTYDYVWMNHESMYKKGIVGWSFFSDSTLWFPALFESADKKAWILLTEAAVYGDFCASQLEKYTDGKFRVKHTKIGTYCGDVYVEDALFGKLPWTTPWRVAIIGATPGPIIESNLVENLNPPSEIADMSWIKPGRTTWTWWYGSNEHQKFSDFGKEMGWESGEGRSQFWYDWKGHWQGHSQRAQFTATGSLEEALDKDLAQRAASGRSLLKCDFMDGDDQGTMQDYDLIARLCMKHKIMLNWHGARLPGGERRRWPHMIGYEGVLGAEHYKWSPGPTLFDRLCLPFTRNVVGPMDFTGVTFTGPALDKRGNSDAAELAVAMLYENGMQYWGDHPDAYRARPAAMSFLKKCPPAWEETRFVSGYPGAFVCLARRTLQGDTWFIGAMSGVSEHVEQVPLSFLTSGQTYQLELHSDGDSLSNIITKVQKVTSKTLLSVHVLSNGGFCGVLEKVSGN